MGSFPETTIDPHRINGDYVHEISIESYLMRANPESTIARYKLRANNLIVLV